MCDLSETRRRSQRSARGEPSCCAAPPSAVRREGRGRRWFSGV